MSVGQTSSFTPDYGKAKAAAARVYDLLDRSPAIISDGDDERVKGGVTNVSGPKITLPRIFHIDGSSNAATRHGLVPFYIRLR